MSNKFADSLAYLRCQSCVKSRLNMLMCNNTLCCFVSICLALSASVTVRAGSAGILMKKLSLAASVLLLSACSFLQPAPEIVDDGPKEKPLPPQLVEGYNAGLELLQDMVGEDENDEALQSANQHWQKLAEQFVEYPGVWTNLALTQYHLEKYQDSHASLIKALEINAEFCPTFKLKGLVERELGKFKDAEASYLAAADCDPNDADVAYNLGILYDLYMQDLEKALAQYQKAQSLLSEPDETLAVWIPDLQRRTGADKAAQEQVAGE